MPTIVWRRRMASCVPLFCSDWACGHPDERASVLHPLDAVEPGQPLPEIVAVVIRHAEQLVGISELERGEVGLLGYGNRLHEPSLAVCSDVYRATAVA